MRMGSESDIHHAQDSEKRLCRVGSGPSRGSGFFTDASETGYVAVARRRGFMTDGGETGAEFKAGRG